jgi:hypothetical protein
MKTAYFIHIAAGSVGLLAGHVALYATKGAPVHRRAGTVFVYAMLAMCVAGALIAVARGVAPAVNVPAAAITAYMILTALAAVREPGPHFRRWHQLALAVALAIVAGEGWLAYSTLAWGAQERGYLFPFFMFGIVAAFGAAGDVQVLRHGPPRGSARIARHLWRMTFALFVAALSFFIGQAQVFPRPIRVMPLLAMPVLAVLVTMFYWLWRVRVRGSLRGMIGLRTIEA